MEIFKVIALFVLSVFSCRTIIRFFNKIKMRAVSVLFGIFFAASFVFAAIYVAADIITKNLGSIYSAGSVLETFVLMEVEWLTVPLAAFKTFTIGSAIISLIIVSAVALIAARAARAIYRIVGRKAAEFKKPSSIRKDIACGVSFVASMNNKYLEFGRLRN